MQRSRLVVTAVVPLAVAALASRAGSSLGYAGSVARSSTPHPLIITERDSGKTFRLIPRSRASLRLSSQKRWSPPRVRGKAIELVAVSYLLDPGFSEWTIRILGTGKATITSAGTPNCATGSPCPGAVKRFTVKILVPNLADRERGAATAPLSSLFWLG